MTFRRLSAYASALGIALAQPASAQFTLGNTGSTGLYNPLGHYAPYLYYAAIGEQFTMPATTFTSLDEFTFFAFPATNNTVNAFLYEWSSVTHRIIGNELWSTSLSVPHPANNLPYHVTVNTGGVTLTPGVNYAIFFSEVGIPGDEYMGFGGGNPLGIVNGPNSITPIPSSVIELFDSGFSSVEDFKSVAWTQRTSDDLFMTLAYVLPDGDPVTPTPEPASVVLFGTGLLAIAGLSRRSAKTRAMAERS